MAEATVLIVDDEVRVLDSLEALLAMDYRVLRAERPEAALELLAGEAVALVISDQRMPGMTGTELLARCREVAPEAVRVLLTAFTDADALMESINQGTVEQLIGDEIVVLFGVTEDAADAPGRAVRAAIDMVAAVKGLSKRWAADGLPRFDIGVGIASGPVMAGTIGSAERRELTVVGRPMIAAARIQRMTRLFEAHIIAAESTFRDVEALVRHRELGSPKLKGLKDRETLYEILGMREPASTAP